MSTNLWDGTRYDGKWLSGTTLYAEIGTIYVVIPIVSAHEYQVTCVTSADRYRWATFAANPHDSTANGIRSVYSNDSAVAGTAFTFTADLGENYLMGYIGHASASPSGSNAKVAVYDNTAVNYKTSGSAIYTVHGITGAVASSTIAWTEDKPTGTTVSVSVSTDGSSYTAVTNGGQFLPPGSYDNVTVYIKVELATTDATLTPTISGIKVTVTDEKYLNFVSEPRNGVFKIYCDISAQTKGVSISHQKNSRLHFWDGTQVPVFSEWFSVAGLASMLDAGYFYEKAEIDEVMTATESNNMVMWASIVIPSISETANITGPDLTATENVNIVLT